MRNTAMRDDYDFSKSTKNPYAKKLKKQEWHKKRDEAFARGEVLKPKK